MRSFFGDFVYAMSPVLVGVPVGFVVGLLTNSGWWSLAAVAVTGVAWILLLWRRA